MWLPERATWYVPRRVLRFAPHHPTVLVAALILALVSASGAAGASSSASRTPKAQKVSEHVSLRLVKRTGSTKFEHVGRASGTVAGPVRSVITLAHAVVLQGTVTVTTKQGQLRLKINGRARSLELHTKFDGTATIAGGTGRYAHAGGSGTFSGVVDRSSWATTIDATGSLTY
jgi:hypothetical protein